MVWKNKEKYPHNYYSSESENNPLLLLSLQQKLSKQQRWDLK